MRLHKAIGSLGNLFQVLCNHFCEDLEDVCFIRVARKRNRTGLFIRTRKLTQLDRRACWTLPTRSTHVTSQERLSSAASLMVERPRLWLTALLNRVEKFTCLTHGKDCPTLQRRTARPLRLGWAKLSAAKLESEG